MAHKKAGSSSRNGRDSAGQRLGVKVGDGQKINAGNTTMGDPNKTRAFAPTTAAGPI